MDSQPTHSNGFTSANSTGYNFHTTQKMNPHLKKTGLMDLLQDQRLAGHIDLNDKYIRDDGVQVLANFVSQNPEIKTLMIRGNKISSDGFADLCSALCNTHNLQKLSAEWNEIGVGTKGLSALYEFVSCIRSFLGQKLEISEVYRFEK